MAIGDILLERHYLKNLTKVKLVLLFSFCLLITFQFFTGFREFEDYLVVFIFILFLNDLFLKINRPFNERNQNEKIKRWVMTLVFLLIYLLPFIFDLTNISNEARLFIYKLGFVLWAQIFLIDSFMHYKQTHSRQWLVFTNTAALMIIAGAFIY